MIRNERIAFCRLTHPENYSAASMLHATRMFAATSSPKVCERSVEFEKKALFLIFAIFSFYKYYLLPRCMDDIMEYRKLNVHLFSALKKAVYKPEAFVKGIVLPWCQSDAFTMTAAHVLRAVLASIKVPVVHAATAVVKLARLPICGPLSYVLAGLLKKRYSLPALAINALIRHFGSYDAEEPMELSLNGCIAVLVEFYHHELSDEQRKSLIELLEVRRARMPPSPLIFKFSGQRPSIGAHSNSADASRRRRVLSCRHCYWIFVIDINFYFGRQNLCIKSDPFY